MFDWLRVVNMVLPTVVSVIPGLPAVLVPLIVQSIMEAESMKDASGADKKAFVTREVVRAISVLNSSKGGAVIDPVKVMPIVELAIDKGIAIVNLLARNA